jgi:hypothetical protein
VPALPTLRLEVRPSPETNDHEVRVLVDGEDLINARWPDMIGLDPDDLLVSPSPLRAGTRHDATVVARCDCGIVGCGSQEVRVVAQGERVLWRFEEGDELAFAAGAYLTEIECAERDTSWETPDRTAARLVRQGVDRQALARHGLRFDWSSARVAEGRFTVALTLQPGPNQVLVSYRGPESPPTRSPRRSSRSWRARRRAGPT